MKKKLVCSLTVENLAKKRCIGRPKAINFQQGKCMKMPSMGKMQTGCLQFLCNISKYIKIN